MKTKKQKNQAQKEWRDRNKYKNKHSVYQSTSKNFINNFATLEELEQLEILIQEKRRKIIEDHQAEYILMDGLSDEEVQHYLDNNFVKTTNLFEENFLTRVRN